jgi:hypothetical protein
VPDLGLDVGHVGAGGQHEADVGAPEGVGFDVDFDRWYARGTSFAVCPSQGRCDDPLPDVVFVTARARAGREGGLVGLCPLAVVEVAGDLVDESGRHVDVADAGFGLAVADAERGGGRGRRRIRSVPRLLLLEVRRKPASPRARGGRRRRSGRGFLAAGRDTRRSRTRSRAARRFSRQASPSRSLSSWIRRRRSAVWGRRRSTGAAASMSDLSSSATARAARKRIGDTSWHPPFVDQPTVAQIIKGRLTISSRLPTRRSLLMGDDGTYFFRGAGSRAISPSPPRSPGVDPRFPRK